MPAGRPPKYKTPEDMQKVIDEYFERVKFKENDTTTYRPTMAGIANALGMSRQALLDYKKKNEFLDTIKKARWEVEEALESALYGNGVAGVIFNLKNNFGWKDKQEIASTNSHLVKEVNSLEDLDELTDEKLIDIIRGN